MSDEIDATTAAVVECKLGCKPGGACRWVGCKNAGTEAVETVVFVCRCGHPGAGCSCRWGYF